MHCSAVHVPCAATILEKYSSRRAPSLRLQGCAKQLACPAHGARRRLPVVCPPRRVASLRRGKGESVSKPRGPQRPVYDDDDDGDYLPPHRSTARGGGGRGGGGSMVMEMDDYDEDYP